ncbi:putative chromodomain-helicase-DNA-binding protein 8-like isoform X3 [Apostichopus japonicus]|uniref:Putative chromodomain-helicase-DNA-binding protein 8-like isoform X3 n=1 Tax=Stichopus japonicus TaxID=307972 RepID=A0A2G8K972_STIJA|nr:putative chromodomain-helicase-DNA-binding protein 8-like isoform X3 [Apostichopus japonicus]
MAEQVTNNTSSATVVSTTITTPGTTQIVASVPATNIQLASASKPQLVVQSPQQQVLILPPGATTIPQTQLSQITIRQPAQNNVQLLGHTPLQVVNQPTGPVTVVSQGQSTGSQMFYIVSPTRTVTSSKPQAVVSGNKDIVSQLGSVSSVPNAIQAQQTLVSSPAPSSTVTQILQQSPSAGTLVANSSQNALLGLSTAQSVGGLPTVVSQSPVLTTQGSVSQKATSIKVIPKVGGSLLSGQTQTGSQPVTLQLKITDPALLQKLGLQQGKGHVLNLSGMNLSNLLANQKVQLVGKSSTGTTLQTLAGQTVKIPSSISTVTQAGGNKNLQSVATNVGLPQTSSSVILKTVSTQPVTTVASVSTVVSTMATQQPITVFSSQKGQQQIVMLKQPIVSSSQSPQTLSVMGSPQAGTQRVLLQGAQKVTNSIPGGLGASFVIETYHLESKLIGCKELLAVHDPTSANVVQTTSGQQEVSKLSVAPKQETASSELSAVCSELKSVSQSTANTLSSGVLSNTVIGSTVTAKTTSPVKAQNTVVIKSTDATVSLASSISSSVSSITAKPATTVSVGGQNFVSKFIRILPPKPGQKQTQMVISVNPNTDVNGEVKEISKELAQLQGQPKTHDTLKKLQDLQTRLQQLQVVTQLLKKAKIFRHPFGAEEEEEEKKKKKKDKSSRKSKKKDSKRKDSKDKKRDRERTRHPPKKKHPPSKKLPAAAILKFKRQKRKHGEDNSDSSDFDETPPRSPVTMLVDEEGEVMQRRSGRNTTRKKYTEDYDFKITDDESSSSSDNNDGKKQSSKHQKKKSSTVGPPPPQPVVRSIKVVKQEENPDEDEANIIEKILAFRKTKKPPHPGEAQVGEVEEFFVKYRNFSYLHSEWQTTDKIKDPRIHQKVKRFKQKLRNMTPVAIQQMEEEPFNPDYMQVDRILDEAVTKDEVSGEEVTHYLVKWASLPYEDSTWELSSDVLQAKIDFFHKIGELPPDEVRVRKTKAKSIDWEKIEDSPEYKDGNCLRDYQLEGVNWLMFSWCNGQNCILADEMGLGKTIQSIGFLTEVVKYGIIGPFLVIAPLSTIANWQREFETWTDMNAVVYHGSAQSRHMIAEFEMFYKDADGSKVPNIYKFQVLITTYEILLADCQELSEIEWRVVIIDEAHRLKNRNCKLLEGLKILDVEHRVLLTGTPLQNNVEELFSLLNFLEPGRFRSLPQFLDDFGDLKTESQVERLQQLLKPMMLRRLKEDVEKSLAPKEETIIEVELTSIQKRYYRAILERNFSFLQKGAQSTTNLPNLMNTMMELRKCCNHPFLINVQIQEDEYRCRGSDQLEMNAPGQFFSELIHVTALIQSSGKMVLLDKLLPRLKEGGHKVLVFSQMIRCLDILEDYLIQKSYLFERIDGRVRGNMRQAAIDRFSKPDSDRFIFLLCTRAGGLGINLTAADTCIIFDSDWNPQNDLQAQARCHRIGQEKAVKVYRLITRNSYEREMFDKASMKLGLDKAVLQSMRADKDSLTAPQPLTKTEIEDLLRKGAYGAIMEDDESSSKFCEEDIEIILQRRTKIVHIESGVKGSTFAKASFTVASDHADIKIDDPDFWQKWAKKADIQIRDSREEKIIMAPRQRKQTRRYGGNDMMELSSSEEDEVAPKEEKPSKKQLQSGWTRLECFRVEKGLLTFGWGCWEEIIATTRFRRRLGEKDIEAISRTMLIYCLQHYKGDENIKSFIWDLVTPAQDGAPKDFKQHKGLSVLVPRGGRKSKKPKKEEPVVPCILEFDFNNKDKNAEQLLNDDGYKNHLKRHCNKVLLRVRLLYYLRHEIIGPMARQISEGAPATELNLSIPPPEGEKPIAWWDTLADKSLLVGVFKHGYEKYHQMRLDPCLCYLERCGKPRQDEMLQHAQDADGMNDSQLDVEAMEQEPSVLPKHIKDEMEVESASPSSTRPSSPATPNVSKRKSVNLIPSEAGKLPFPQAPDLNTRVRRLVAGFQREQKKKQLKEAKKEKKDQVKKIRMQEQLRLRELRKMEGAQKWSRREESDFYRILAAFGVELDQESGNYNWTNFKKLAKLERKYDHRMQEFYEHYRVMCLKVCKRDDEIPADYAQKPPLDFQIEAISEERASKCLQRIDLLLKVRSEVLPHPKLEERLKLCQKSVELPEWWQPGKHDNDLLLGVSRYGINRMESQQMMMNDPELSFKELKEKYPQMGVPPPGAFTTRPKGEGKKKKKPAKQQLH